MSIRNTATALGLVAAFSLVGCHRPGGAFMSYTGGSHTYYSVETQPKSVRLMDVRTNEVVFSMDIPVGKQLTLDFVPEKGDDPVYSPDLMRYQVFDIGTQIGSLRSSMSVPNSSSRKLEFSIRDGVEYAAVEPDRALRSDEMIDRPGWWTAEGGEMPEDPMGINNYED